MPSAVDPSVSTSVTPSHVKVTTKLKTTKNPLDFNPMKLSNISNSTNVKNISHGFSDWTNFSDQTDISTGFKSKVRFDTSLDSLDENNESLRNSNDNNGHSYPDESVSIIFQNTNSNSRSQMSEKSTKTEGLYNKMPESFSVVFDDSGCDNHDSNDNNVEHSSLFFPDQHWMEHENAHDRVPTLPFGETRDHSTSPFSNPDTADDVLVTSNRAANVNLPFQRHDSENNCAAAAATKDERTKNTPKLYLYIQMQLCQRESLKDWLKTNTLNRDRRTVLDYFDQIVGAVDYIHDNGLMHRDLKVSLIFLLDSVTYNKTKLSLDCVREGICCRLQIV